VGLEYGGVGLGVDKAKTGFKPLDEKLDGGLDRGMNVIVLGSPLSGKKIFSKEFLYTGLLEGEACILTCTGNMAEEEHKRFEQLGMNVSEFEEKGLLRYIDFYSRTTGLQYEEKPYIKRISSIMDLTGYNVAIRDLIAEFWRQEIPMRMIFDSVSTLLLYNKFNTVARFLHALLGRLKSVGVISLYLVEEGAHEKDEITTLIAMMDGLIEMKVEDDKRFLRFKSEQKRIDWIPYEWKGG